MIMSNLPVLYKHKKYVINVNGCYQIVKNNYKLTPFPRVYAD